MFKRVPDDFPVYFAVTLASAFLAFGFAGMTAANAFGRPSSTSALGFIFVPIWAILLGVVGIILGIALRLIWRITSKREVNPIRAKLWMTRIYVSVVIGAGFVGVCSVPLIELGAKPRIILNKGLLQNVPVPTGGVSANMATRLYESTAAPTVLEWGKNKTETIISGVRVTLRDQHSGAKFEISAKGLDYVTSIDAVPLTPAKDTNPYLIIVITGRATGHRALLVVISSSYDVVYSERLDREWPIDSKPLEVRYDSNLASEVGVLWRRAFIVKKAA